MKHILIILLSIVFLWGCKKDPEEKKESLYNYHGYIYKISDSTPYANTSFICYQGKPRTSVNDPKEEIVPFTTDENGYFSIDVPVFNNSSGIMVCWPDNYQKYSGCPENNSFFPNVEYNKYEYDVGKIYMP